MECLETHETIRVPDTHRDLVDTKPQPLTLRRLVSSRTTHASRETESISSAEMGCSVEPVAISFAEPAYVGYTGAVR